MSEFFDIPLNVRDAAAMPRIRPPEDMELLFDYEYSEESIDGLLEWNASRDLAMMVLDAESEAVSDDSLFAIFVGTRGEWMSWIEYWEENGWEAQFVLEDKFVCLCDEDGRVVYPKKALIRSKGLAARRTTTAKRKAPARRTATKKRTTARKPAARRTATKGARR